MPLYPLATSDTYGTISARTVTTVAIIIGLIHFFGHAFNFFGATVCKTILLMLSVRCPVCLSVTFVHCGQTVGRIEMKLGMPVGLGPGHTVLDGDPDPLPKGAQPPIFCPYQLRPNGCMDQDVTWYGARPRLRRLCVSGGPRSPLRKGGRAPNFRPMFIVAKRLDGCSWYLAWW